MTQPRSLTRTGIALALGVLMSGAVAIHATPASAQDMDDQGQQQPLLTEPQPLISVRPGPAVPSTGAPEQTGDLPALPAQYSQPVGPFTMYMDVIATGPSEYGLFAAPGCVLDGVFKRGMKLVWRFEVYDMSTGMRLTDRDGAQVSVTLPDGTVAPAAFIPRGEPGNVPPDAPWTWVAVWNIPPDYPLGPVDYSVDVSTPDGRSGSMHPSSWGSLYPMIVD